MPNGQEHGHATEVFDALGQEDSPWPQAQGSPQGTLQDQGQGPWEVHGQAEGQGQGQGRSPGDSATGAGYGNLPDACQLIHRAQQLKLQFSLARTANSWGPASP